MKVRIDASDARSTARSSTLAPAAAAAARTGSAARSPFVTSRTPSTTSAPCAATARAVSWPNPADAPVISTRAPDRSTPSRTSSVVDSLPKLMGAASRTGTEALAQSAAVAGFLCSPPSTTERRPRERDAQPARRRAVHDVGRGHRRRTGRREHPDAHALARPHERRPGADPGSAQARGSVPQRGPGLHDGGGQDGGPSSRARGDQGLPGPRLPRARADLGRAAPRDDVVARRRGRPGRVRAHAHGGDGARRRRRASGRCARRCCRARSVPRGRDRMWPVRAPRGDPVAGGGHPVHDRREERGRRWDLVRELVSRRARRRRQPLLLLQLRAQRPVDRVLRATARAPVLLRRRDAQARHRTERPLGDRGARRRMGRRVGQLDRARRARPTAPRRRSSPAR